MTMFIICIDVRTILLQGSSQTAELGLAVQSLYNALASENTKPCIRRASINSNRALSSFEELR